MDIHHGTLGPIYQFWPVRALRSQMERSKHVEWSRSQFTF